MEFTDRLFHAWNAFLNKDPTTYQRGLEMGYGYSSRPDRPRLSRGNERSIVTAVYNRIGLLGCKGEKMRFYKLLNEDGTLNRIGTGEDSIEITKEEYSALLEDIRANAVHEDIDDEFFDELEEEETEQ